MILRAGEYHLGHLPLLLGPDASGLELVAASNEEAVITGGTELKPDWQPWRGPGASGSANTFVAEIPVGMLPDGATISELLVGGRRMVTAREPDADVYDYRTWQGGIQAAAHWGTMRWGDEASNRTATLVEKSGPAWRRNISCGDVHFKGAFGGSLDAFADGRGCGWAGHVPMIRQKGLTWNCPASQGWCRKPWRNASEASVWCTGVWANLGYEVSDQKSRHANNLTTVNLTFGSGGNQMAFGPLWPGQCNEFFVEGIIEALSSPGEFYHDRTSGRLFIVTEPGAAPPKAVLAVTAETLLRFVGSQQRPVRDIRLEGLTFRGAAKTFLGPHVSTTNGADWAVPRSGAVVLEGVEGAKIERCVFDTLGGTAVLWSGYVRDATVSNSTFSWLGGNGVLAIGDDDWGNATAGDYPLNNTIVGCLFREIGVFAKHSAAYAEFVAGAVTIKSSIIFNVARAGIALNDAMGGGNLVVSNLLFHCVRESSDREPTFVSSARGLPLMNALQTVQ